MLVLRAAGGGVSALARWSPVAEAQAGSALILEEVNRPTFQLASSAASPRALFPRSGVFYRLGSFRRM